MCILSHVLLLVITSISPACSAGGRQGGGGHVGVDNPVKTSVGVAEKTRMRVWTSAAFQPSVVQAAVKMRHKQN